MLLLFILSVFIKKRLPSIQLLRKEISLVDDLLFDFEKLEVELPYEQLVHTLLVGRQMIIKQLYLYIVFTLCYMAKLFQLMQIIFTQSMYGSWFTLII